MAGSKVEVVDVRERKTQGFASAVAFCGFGSSLVCACVSPSLYVSPSRGLFRFVAGGRGWGRGLKA